MNTGYELPDNHYCDRCLYSNPGHFDMCQNCSYNPTDGFSEWVPVAFNKKETMYNVISKPKHYMLMDGLEVRDVLAALVSKLHSANIPESSLFVSDYVQMMQYFMRFMDKNGKQDLEKGKYYLEKLINAYD